MEAYRSSGQALCSKLLGQSVGGPGGTPAGPRPCLETEVAECFRGHPAPTLTPILSHFLLVSPCGQAAAQPPPEELTASCRSVHGLRPGRCSCLLSVYQDGRHVNACSICSQRRPFGWNYRNSNPVAKKRMLFLKKEGHQDVPCAYLGAGHGPLMPPSSCWP